MTVSEQLKDMMDDYLAANPFASINGLAKKSGVGASTLRRILSSSIKGDPAPNTALNLSCALSNEKNLAKILTNSKGALGEYLKDSFGIFAESNLTQSYNLELNEVLDDEIKYFIYKLAANAKGTSKIEIAELYGQLGLKKLDEMLSIGIILKNEDEFHASEKNFSLDISLAIKHLPKLISFYKKENIQLGKNLFYSLSESMNVEGIDRIKKIEKDAVEKIAEIMKTPFFQGDSPYFSVIISDEISLKKSQEIYQ